MSEKEVQLIEKQIERLKVKDFDLESWKKYTIVILAKIFGKKSEKIELIDNLEFEFNSWSLRDASGNESYEEGTKKLAKEILQAAIDEIKVFGIPGKDEVAIESTILSDFLSIILDELKGSQVRKIKKVLLSKVSREEKRRMIKEIVESVGEYGAYNILTELLMHPSAKSVLGI